MNVNAMGAIIILISAVSCFATYLITTKFKIWGLRLIPALLCLVGAAVCYFIYTHITDIFDFSSLSYTIVIGISFAVAFSASLLTIGMVYIKIKWAEVFKKQGK
jgi:hypothetical protein